MKGEEPRAEMAPGGMCLSQHIFPKKRDRLLWHSWEVPDTAVPTRPGQAEGGCGFQVRKLRARRDFGAQGRGAWTFQDI